MDLFIVGQGKVSLGETDFVTRGGEASIYARGDVAYKLYTDPRKMLPPAKIRELAALTRPCIIRPEAILLDARNRPAGYTMRRVRDAHVLCQLFNRAFRERQGITSEAMVRLVRKLQEGIRHVHDKGILIVDLNEMNFLLDRALREILFIDVDSYQTPGFPATALMDSIRDRHAAQFSRETDWFSFGILSFQMLVGIHPYKGKHPTLGDLDARMRANVSALNPEVSIPKVCYPFSVIPPALLEWYRAIFEEGKRVPPPEDLRHVILIAPKVSPICGSGQLKTHEIHRFPAEIIAPLPACSMNAAVTTDGLYIAERKYAVGSDVRIGLTPRMNRCIAAWIEGRRIELFDITAGRRLESELEGEALTEYDGRIYVKQDASLNELRFIELPAGIRTALTPVGNAMPNATRLFDGVAIQSLLGSCYASVFPRPGACHSVRLPELDPYRVVDARFDNNVLMVAGIREGRYDRFVFRFDELYRSYDLRIVLDISYAGLNFVVLESGVCLHVNENEELELFSNERGSPSLKVIADPAVHGVRLFKNGTRALFARGDCLYSIAMNNG
jgi:hypothetical protein